LCTAWLGGGALLTKDYHCQIRHLSLKAIIATARALLLELDGYHMGVGAFPFLGVKRRRHRDREYGTEG